MQIETVVQSGHYLHIASIAFSPDGSLLATCSPDESVRLWDLNMGCEAAVLKGHIGPVYQVVFNNSGDLIASCSWDLTIRLWDPKARLLKHTLQLPAKSGILSVDEISFAGCGRLLASGSSSRFDDPGHIHVWDCVTGEAVHSYEVPEKLISALDFSPDGRFIAIGHTWFDFVGLRILDAGTGETAFYIKDEVKQEVGPSGGARNNISVSLAFSADSKLLFAAYAGQLREVDIERQVSNLLPLNDIFKVQRDAQGNLVAFGKSCITIWDVFRHKELERIDTWATYLSPNGNLLARADGRTLELVDRHSCTVIRRLGSQLQLPKQIGNMRRQFVVCASPVYPILASGACDGRVRLWDLAKAGAPLTFHAHEEFIEAMAFSPDGSLLATGGDDGKVKLWQGKNGHPVHSICVDSGISCLSFSVSGAVLYAGLNDGRVAVIDVCSGMLKAQAGPLHDSKITGIAAPPGDRIITTGLQKIVVWDPDFRPAGATDLGIQIHSLANSRQGVLAFGVGHTKWFGMSDTRMIQGIVGLFVPKVGFTHYLTGHAAPVMSVAFSPDGKTVVGGGADGKVVTWDVQSGRKLLSIDAHAGEVTAVCYLVYGFFIASIGFDSVVRLWAASSGELVATLVSLNDEDYVSITAEGYYTATKPGLRSVMFRADNRIFPFDQFDLQLNRPDQVLKKLAFGSPDLIDAYRQVHERRLRSLGFSLQGGLEKAGTPEIELISPPPGAASHKRTLILRVRLSSPQTPLERLLVYSNDVPIHGQAGIDVRMLGLTGEMDVEIQLMSGDNKVQLCAVDKAGVKSRMLSFRTFFVNEGAKSDLYILAVGVSRYAAEKYNLEYAAKDACDLVSEISVRQAIFREVKTKLLVDGEATKTAIMEGRTFLQGAGIDDHVIIMFAGHGTIEKGEYFFLPTAFSEHDVEHTGVSYTAIQSLLDGIPARRRLVLLDTCHAGEPEDAESSPAAPQLSSGVKRVRSSMRNIGFIGAEASSAAEGQVALLARMPELFADLRRDSGATVIAAAAASEYAREFEELENGVFTSCVIQAFREHEATGRLEGRVRVSDLHRYVARNVEALTGGAQRPISRRENISDDFPVL